MKRIMAILLAFAMLFTLSACGHKHTWEDATCTTPKTCSKCGETEGEPLGHKWGEVSFEWAEDHSSVTATRVCENDASHIETETVAVSTETAGADSDAPGKTVYTAPFENEAFAALPLPQPEEEPAAESEPSESAESEEASESAEPVEPAEPTWAEPTYEWAEDLSSVTATRISEEDESLAETEIAEVSAEVVKAPSCEEPGETAYTATFGNPAFAAQSRTETDLEPLGHSWGEPTYDWAEDRSSVTATRVCANDEGHVETETAAVSAEVTKDPSCEEAGETTYTAAFENEAFAAQTRTEADLAPLGHDWGEPTYTWAEDMSSVTATRVCANDEGHVETETAAVTAEVTKEPGCEEAGETTYTAAFENEAFAAQSRTEADLAPLGHAWGEVSYDWAEDFSSVTATRSCANDPAHVESETAAVSAEVSRPATCEEMGATTYTAAFENAAFAAQSRTETDIAALGHSWEKATHTAPQTCSVCGATEGEPLPIHYFDMSFREYRSLFNHSYPGFLNVDKSNDKGFVLKVKGDTMQTNGLRGSIPFYHTDEFDPAPLDSLTELEQFNLIRLRYDANTAAFDTSLSGRISQLGYYAAKVLDPSVQLDDFFKLGLDLFHAKGQTQSFTRNGYVYTLACEQLDESGYRYDFTIGLEGNLE